MSIELVVKKQSDGETPLIDENSKTKFKAKDDEETRKSLSSPQRKHSVNVVPFSVSLENMKKVSTLIQDVTI